MADTWTRIDVQRVAKDGIVARVLFSGSAILRGLPAWVPVYKCVYALIRRACAGLGGQPASGLRGGQSNPGPNPSCPNIDKKMGAKSYLSSIQSALALHTCYPGHKGHNPEVGSQLARAINIIDDVFNNCSHAACIPKRSNFRADYITAGS